MTVARVLNDPNVEEAISVAQVGSQISSTFVQQPAVSEIPCVGPCSEFLPRRLHASFATDHPDPS